MPETLRSTVHPWECDAVDHFTTAYYFRAFGLAEWHLMQLIGLSESEIAALRPVSCRTGFSRELRAGDAYHVESGVVEHGPERLAIGHRLFNSETGELCSTHLQTFAGAIKSGAKAPSMDWEEEPSEPAIDFARYGVWSATSRMVVRTEDLDHAGRLDLAPLIHHTSDANVQFQNRIGMTSSYMRESRIGFATFGYRIRIHELPRRPGAVLQTDTALARLGRSSLWFAHRVVNGLSGAPIAEVAQLGVHFDRVARAAAAIPDEVRQSARGFLGAHAAAGRRPATPSAD